MYFMPIRYCMSSAMSSPMVPDWEPWDTPVKVFEEMTSAAGFGRG